MTDKTPNYTEEAVARLHEVYDGDASVEERDAQIQALADEVGKSPASIRAKLTREGIYVAKGPKPKKGLGVTKANLVTAIAKEIEVDEDVIGSLEKATKVTLGKILFALRAK